MTEVEDAQERIDALEDAGLSGREAQAQALRERRHSRGEIADAPGITRGAVNSLLNRVDRKKREAEELLQVLEDTD